MAKPPAKPLVIVIAGPNGSGKSTAAPFLAKRKGEGDETKNLTAWRPSRTEAQVQMFIARMRRHG
jgi:adenylate kinase family enzyme